MKSVFWRVSFSRPGLPFFFFVFVFVPFTYYMLLLAFVIKTESCPLCSEFCVCVMLRSYMLMLFQYLWIPSKVEPDVTLRYHCMQTLELVQTKNSMSSHSVRFSSRVLNLSSKKYKAKYFDWKNTKKVLKPAKLITQISKFRLIYEKITKSLFSFPVY